MWRDESTWPCVWLAEVHTERGRVAASFAAAASSSAEHFRLGWGCFQRVLEAAAAGGGTGRVVHSSSSPKTVQRLDLCGLVHPA